METDYWHRYFSEQLIERSDRIRKELAIRSTGVNIPIDLGWYTTLVYP